MIDKTSNVMKSNLFTMGVAKCKDSRQEIPIAYTIPCQEIRLLRAKLILEEALETISALGFNLLPRLQMHAALDSQQDFIFQAHRYEGYEHILEDIIDGCCDTIYVAVGTLASCGVPDLPHLDEVCRANNDKFPGGLAIVNSDGKYTKPVGWKGPDHDRVKEVVMEDHLEDLIDISLSMVNDAIQQNCEESDEA